jgi:hypothetical protein
MNVVLIGTLIYCNYYELVAYSQSGLKVGGLGELSPVTSEMSPHLLTEPLYLSI